MAVSLCCSTSGETQDVVLPSHAIETQLSNAVMDDVMAENATASCFPDLIQTFMLPKCPQPSIRTNSLQNSHKIAANLQSGMI